MSPNDAGRLVSGGPPMSHEPRARARVDATWPAFGLADLIDPQRRRPAQQQDVGAGITRHGPPGGA